MKPVVAVVCDTSRQGPHMYHQAGDKYIQALVRCADITPVLIPSLEQPIRPDAIFAFADGILFTGGYSNIQRHHYGDAPAPTGENEDRFRDNNTLALVKAVIDRGIPMFGICRGLQELNVALGGTLYPRVHEIEGRMDHREDKDAPVDVQYGPAHYVSVMESGRLHKIVGNMRFMVNSVHGQAIRELAPGLAVEAVADDETIEAVSVVDADAFALAVQWHPEWKAWEDEQSSKLFRAFGDAARTHKSNRP